MAGALARRRTGRTRPSSTIAVLGFVVDRYASLTGSGLPIGCGGVPNKRNGLRHTAGNVTLTLGSHTSLCLTDPLCSTSSARG